MNKANLRHVIQTLKAVQRRDKEQGHKHFYMDAWVVGKPGECGTAACALGWEAQTQYANNRGLKLILKYSDYVPVIKRKHGIDAGTKYIGSDVVANVLFDPEFYAKGYASEISEGVKITEVIARAEKILKEGEQAARQIWHERAGYEYDEKGED